jgi:hypothetical protein
MTPKEKAEELVNYFNPFVYCYIGSGMLTNDVDDSAIRINAKRCALIAVTQIINEYESKICNTGYDYDFERWDMQRDYWKEVQFEISKLKTE